MIPTYLKIIIGFSIGSFMIHFLSLFGLWSFPMGYSTLVFALFLFSMAREFYRQYQGASRRSLITVLIVVGIMHTGGGLWSFGLTYGWIR
ncbi:hypothetical protein [Marinococcus sp. PL1-022]|uniref:hypothetical protein n=1 Tax=Marinococcus sp. PL1-022 TaxID=3095363 RepID=UPI0029C2990D|nr:hypothetical protein [Marinococcus sp. PL1-022]MDX6154514.1 hypothetical protein [Marinococcus sp. PL1-022]